jgi:hypothetical protein
MVCDVAQCQTGNSMAYGDTKKMKEHIHDFVVEAQSTLIVTN